MSSQIIDKGEKRWVFHAYKEAANISARTCYSLLLNKISDNNSVCRIDLVEKKCLELFLNVELVLLSFLIFQMLNTINAIEMVP